MDDDEEFDEERAVLLVRAVKLWLLCHAWASCFAVPGCVLLLLPAPPPPLCACLRRVPPVSRCWRAPRLPNLPRRRSIVFFVGACRCCRCSALLVEHHLTAPACCRVWLPGAPCGGGRAAAGGQADDGDHQRVQRRQHVSGLFVPALCVQRCLECGDHQPVQCQQQRRRVFGLRRSRPLAAPSTAKAYWPAAGGRVPGTCLLFLPRCLCLPHAMSPRSLLHPPAAPRATSRSPTPPGPLMTLSWRAS